MVMQCLNFFQQLDSNGTGSKEFHLNKYTSNNLKGCILEVDLEYPKELRELHNNYPLTPVKIEIKREMLLSINEIFPIYLIFLFVMLKVKCLAFLIKKGMCFIMTTCNFT